VWHLIPQQLPWWLAGPGIGLCVVAMYGLANARLGVSGGWLQVIAAVRRQPVTEPWRIWFLAGLLAGAGAAGLLGAGRVSGYGALGHLLSPAALAVVLLLAGVAIGYGARWAGGCTSGHGIAGCSAGSPESFAATATFFGVAVAVTLLLHLLTGGSL
jgi:uncharacterized membrane protein YedE/YeeE